MQVTNPLGWIVFRDPPEVSPMNDIRYHVCGDACWCSPGLDTELVLVHNALDRREDYQERGRKPS